MYADTKYLTGLAQEKLFKEFKRVVDKRDSSLIKKALYDMLHIHCGFIAHYNIHGFRETYRGLGFRDFVEHFDRLHPKHYHWLGCNSDYAELSRDMADYVTANASNIYTELDDRQRDSEIALAKKILLKHGVSATIEEDVIQESLFAFTPEEDGQLVIGF